MLRRARTPADALPPYVERDMHAFTSHVAPVLIRYVRRDVIGGISYYLVPVHFPRCFFPAPSRVSEGLDVWNRCGGSGVGFEPGASPGALVRRGRVAIVLGVCGRERSSAAAVVVPDGVASVTLRYPAITVGDDGVHPRPAFAVPARVAGNLAVAIVTSDGTGDVARPRMVWRSAAGRVIATFQRL